MFGSFPSCLCPLSTWSTCWWMATCRAKTLQGCHGQEPMLPQEKRCWFQWAELRNKWWLGLILSGFCPYATTWTRSSRWWGRITSKAQQLKELPGPKPTLTQDKWHVNTKSPMVVWDFFPSWYGTPLGKSPPSPQDKWHVSSKECLSLPRPKPMVVWDFSFWLSPFHNLTHHDLHLMRKGHLL